MDDRNADADAGAEGAGTGGSERRAPPEGTPPDGDPSGDGPPDGTEVPFPEVEGSTDAPHLAVAPDGTRYAVPSGMHERLRRTALSAGESGAARDPKVDLALSGWLLLHTDGLTDRLYVDAPDEATDAGPIRRFARECGAGSVAVARHPSGETLRSTDPERFAFDGPADG